ncbi:transcriptional regulator [Sporanaerobium hydrogeniformans]|uniref:Transcriptional regulator n=1 Tax=Sporanaerobium hydrogeniformans TaxID=3072179 RepID=A0AC61DG69_9FIRM|nr:helix-turn-helix transcriptional regulator [Sporanaerobium hydrogeniformans]PHV72151.1 transcriptional regulator [Sporanaerobium hydrogeniformans]
MSDILRLKQIRKKRGLTTKRLSDMSGISRSYISQLENDGNDNPTLIVICALCRGLGITPNDLIPEQLYK